MLGPTDLGRAVVGSRVLILADPPKKKSTGGLHIPADAMVKSFSGVILDAGLAARDRLHDHGIEIGDRVEFGKFAGVLEEWDHIIEGDYSKNEDEYDWRVQPQGEGEPKKYKCAVTGAIRVIEPVFIVNADDILSSCHLDERRRAGKFRYERATAHDGRTQHIIKRA